MKGVDYKLAKISQAGQLVRDAYNQGFEDGHDQGRKIELETLWGVHVLTWAKVQEVLLKDTNIEDPLKAVELVMSKLDGLRGLLKKEGFA